MEIREIFVDYETYCKTCVHQMVRAEDKPCNYCLGHPVNEGSTKPVRWKEKEKP